jgi:phage terminase large subunit
MSAAVQYQDDYLGYQPREHQRQISVALDERRFVVAVMHRRAGKTTGAQWKLIESALGCQRNAPRFAYIAPTFTQAKQIAWDGDHGFKRILEPVRPVVAFNESELRVDFANGARIKLGGAENVDAWRGQYLDGVVLDEVAQMDPRFWPEVIRPCLSDRGGWALFIGTPAGEDAFFDLFQRASSGSDPDWAAFRFRWQDTGALPLHEIESARRDMSPEQFAREYECSFAAGIDGAYYARAMDEAANDGRITSVRYDPKYPVVTGWDLGFGDATAIWCAQPVGGEIRILRYIEDRGRKLADYHEILSSTQLKISQDFLPHDAAAHELIAGRSREETLRSLGRPIRVLPPVRKDDQIEAVRNLLPRCVFDAEGCKDGIRHLRHFRQRPPARGALKTEGTSPLHDEHSHGADAFAQLAIGIRQPALVRQARKQPDTRWIV